MINKLLCWIGYQGNDCSVSACSVLVCPGNSECRIVDAEAKCVCNTGKIGEQCQKGEKMLSLLPLDLSYAVM